MEDQSKITDNIEATTGQGQPSTKKAYEITSEAGLFKNGKQYAKGDKVELDEKTANNFISNNDIKEIQ